MGDADGRNKKALAFVVHLLAGLVIAYAPLVIAVYLLDHADTAEGMAEDIGAAALVIGSMMAGWFLRKNFLLVLPVPAVVWIVFSMTGVVGSYGAEATPVEISVSLSVVVLSIAMPCAFIGNFLATGHLNPFWPKDFDYFFFKYYPQRHKK